jgi:hypothetical protein
MMNYRFHLILTAFLFAAGFYLASAQVDSLENCSSVSSKKIVLLKTAWDESANPAALSYFNCSRNITSAYLWSKWGNGRYHRFQNGNAQRQTGFFTDGFVSLSRWNFYGSFNYFSQKDKNVKWVGVMNPYDDNPYTMGDSIGGNYSKEYFNMEGKSAYRLNERFTLGFGVKYLAGVGAKRKDPRPENTITSFEIAPGIIADFGKIKLGASFRYEGSKEDVEISTVTSNTYYIFHFKGLGVFSSTPGYDDLIHISDLLGGVLQFNFNTKLMDNLTEINFYKKSTDIKRGETYPLQMVLLEKFNTEAATTFLFRPGSNQVNKLKLFFSDKHLYGHEPVVEPKLEAVNYQWATAAKYTLYWHDKQQFGLNYSYYRVVDADHFNWGGIFGARVNTSKTTYYFVPEYNRQNLTLLYLDAALEKGLQLSSSELVFTLGGGYRKNLGSSLRLVADGSLLQTVNTAFVHHDFDYFAATLWNLGASAKIGKKISLYKTQVQVFWEGGYHLLISDLPGNPKWNSAEIKLGMNF